MQIAVTKQVGETLHATNAKNCYIKLIARQRHQIANAIRLTNRCGRKKRHQAQSEKILEIRHENAYI
ncbi:MAG: hypothetical protein OEL84_12120 [Nitrosopumilus sp.]|nr:hypothetical protein [Nitrosopumilus sp.]